MEWVSNGKLFSGDELLGVPFWVRCYYISPGATELGTYDADGTASVQDYVSIVLPSSGE